MAGYMTQIQVPSLGGADSTATEPEKSWQQYFIIGPLQNTTILPPSKIQLRSSRQRRESRSLEKCNTGQFKPLSLCLHNFEAKTGEPLAKRALFKDQVEIGYHASETPEITSVTLTWVLISVDIIVTPHLPNPNRLFGIFVGLRQQNDLALLLVSYLTLQSLMSIFSMSLDFHYHFNRQYTAVYPLQLADIGKIPIVSTGGAATKDSASNANVCNRRVEVITAHAMGLDQALGILRCFLEVIC